MQGLTGAWGWGAAANFNGDPEGGGSQNFRDGLGAFGGREQVDSTKGLF